MNRRDWDAFFFFLKITGIQGDCTLNTLGKCGNAHVQVPSPELWVSLMELNLGSGRPGRGGLSFSGDSNVQMRLRNWFTNSFAIEYDASSNDGNVLYLQGNVGVSIKQVCPKLAMYSLCLPLCSKSTRERSQRMADRALSLEECSNFLYQ